MGRFLLDANNGTAVGEGGTIVRTTDGGSTWIGDFSGTFNILYDVSFTDANTGTVVGDIGTILRTTGSGPTPRQRRELLLRTRPRPHSEGTFGSVGMTSHVNWVQEGMNVRRLAAVLSIFRDYSRVRAGIGQPF